MSPYIPSSADTQSSGSLRGGRRISLLNNTKHLALLAQESTIGNGMSGDTGPWADAVHPAAGSRSWLHKVASRCRRLGIPGYREGVTLRHVGIRQDTAMSGSTSPAYRPFVVRTFGRS